MRISVKYAVWLLALMPLVQGCDQKQKTVQTQTLAPPIVDAPPPKPATVSQADLPPPVIGTPAPPKPASNTPVTPPDAQKKPAHHPRKHEPAPAGTTQEAANANPAPASPSVSAIGQLSGGASGDLRSETEETINTTEKGVNGITRTLSDAELKTAAQIREFLKQARDALATGDADGAHTLAIKAKVLLTELNHQ
jgi:type IV secretory pathway VirB10-like protein